MKSDIEKELEILHEESILINCYKEIRMWREKFLKDAYISHKKEEKEFVKHSIMFSPSGIENIDNEIEGMLKCYREMNK